MTTTKVSESLKVLLKKYNQLPYVAEKRFKKYYIVPHRPTRPKSIHFNIATITIKEHSEKYNQYFSSQKLWEKVAEKFQSQISDSEATQQMPQAYDYRAKIKQFQLKSQEYNYKYKEPLTLMNINSYKIFRQKQFLKRNVQDAIKKNEDNQSFKKSENPQDSKQRKRLKIKNSLQNISKANMMNLSQKWKSLSPEQKQVYVDQQSRIREMNHERIQRFIDGHQVPVIKRYSAISRFITRYAAIYKLQIKDKGLYQKYHELPQEQRLRLSEQSKLMNRESRERYQNFLRKWNFSKQQLNYIIQISEKYRKARVEQYRTTKKKTLRELEKQDDEDEYQDFEDLETQDHDQQ